MKILLAGGYDTKNLGDHASLEVFQNDLRKIDSTTEIVLLSRRPDIEFDKTYNVRSILNLDHKNKKDSIGRWFNGLNPGDNTDHLQTIWKELESSDLLVIGNGRLFVDISLDFMRGPLPYYTLLVTLAKFLNVPIMIFSMTIVPIKTDIGKVLLKYIVSNADIVTVREEPSREELLKLGVPDYKISVYPDAAYGLDYIDRKERGAQILTQEGIDLDNKIFIGMNFRYTHLDTKIDKEYYSSLAKLCDELYQNLRTDILLISQMTYNVDNPLDDDREVHKLVYEYCNNKDHIHIISRECNVFDTLSLYQCCEMLYSMRRHGIIFAATQNIPVFGLSGEKSFSYAMASLNLSEYVTKITELNKRESIKKLISSFKQKKRIRKIISLSITSLRKCTVKYAKRVFRNEECKRAK